MAIDAATSLQEATREYLTNAGYREAASVPQALAFATACRALIILLPQSSMAGGKRADFSIPDLRQELDRAERWASEQRAAQRNGAGSVRHFDFSDLRS